MWQGEFRNPRLVEVYDAQFGWSRDDDYFFAFVSETPGARVADLGCGTGRFTLALAAAGHQVTGVDPARASLDRARSKPGADRVTWLEGTSDVLPSAAFDVAVMTAHVAQFLVTDDDLHRTLVDLCRALTPSGRLAFDTRDPRPKIWEQWAAPDSRRQVLLADGTSVEVWNELEDATDDGSDGALVTLTLHYLFDDGEELTSSGEMRFRSEHKIRESLAAAGLQLDHLYGGWDRTPVGSPDGELLVQARRPSET